MSLVNQNVIGGSSALLNQIPNLIPSSLRFNASQSSYLSKTFSSDGNRTTHTFSAWVKRGALGNGQTLLSSGLISGTYYYTRIAFGNNGELVYLVYNDTNQGWLSSVPVLRDPSAWYHIVAVWDTTNATSTDRIRLYVNNERITSFKTDTFPTTYPALNGVSSIMDASYTHKIGRTEDGQAGGSYFDGYMTEVNFIDGQALDPSSFGEFDSVTGVWKPAKYTGSYGTNGFYLPMQLDNTVEGFNTVTYVGNGSTQKISGVGFQPDLVWIKRRNAAYDHDLFDSVRGAGLSLYSSTTSAEGSGEGQDSFDTDGFTVSGDHNRVNKNGGSFVAWCWDAGSSTVSNTDGSITSSVRANPAYGFSVVSYAGNTTYGATVGHGLGVAPDVIIFKSRSGVSDWHMYHSSISNGNTYLAYLNTTAVPATSNAFLNATYPSSSVITLGNSGGTNGASMIAYCFSEVAGYSKFGAYTGNGSTSGPTITTGFKPAMVLIKRTDTGGNNWGIYDNTRSTNINDVDAELMPSSSAAESTIYSSFAFTDTGFQPTSTQTGTNASGATYIYMAFADTREYAYWLDDSGNNNDWQPNGGITTNSTVTDTPTPYADGGNYCVWNAVAQSTVVNGTVTRSNANLTSTDGGTTYGLASFGTIAVTTGKWYWETTLTTAGGIYANIGVVDLNSSLGAGTHTGIVYAQNGTKNTGSNAFATGGGGAAYGASYTAGDVIGAALDLTTGTITFYKNGTSQGIAYTGISGNYTPAVGDGQNSTSYTFDLNCGQRPFAYTPPTGFLPLHTGNLPDSGIVDGGEYFNTVLYSGNGAARSITGVNFQPDFTWIKQRGTIARRHHLQDAVRTAGRSLFSDATTAEEVSANYLTSFDTDGFSLGISSETNGTGHTYVAWNWKANGAGVSNTDGSITSTVSANPTAGFSIVTYTGTGANATVGHGLGVAPSMIIVKNRTITSTWRVYTKMLGATGALDLDTTIAFYTGSNLWNNTSPTSSVFTVSTNTNTNGSGNSLVAYCFADVEGYSKFGKYTGNGSTDGPFVYTGFRPAFVLIKKSTASESWQLLDNTRNSFNVANSVLFPNSSSAEVTTASVNTDFLSNGFKCRAGSGNTNDSGQTYIYMAFAENPFKNSLAR